MFLRVQFMSYVPEGIISINRLCHAPLRAFPILAQARAAKPKPCCMPSLNPAWAGPPDQPLTWCLTHLARLANCWAVTESSHSQSSPGSELWEGALLMRALPCHCHQCPQRLVHLPWRAPWHSGWPAGYLLKHCLPVLFLLLLLTTENSIVTLFSNELLYFPC